MRQNKQKVFLRMNLLLSILVTQENINSSPILFVQCWYLTIFLFNLYAVLFGGLLSLTFLLRFWYWIRSFDFYFITIDCSSNMIRSTTRSTTSPTGTSTSSSGATNRRCCCWWMKLMMIMMMMMLLFHLVVFGISLLHSFHCKYMLLSHANSSPILDLDLQAKSCCCYTVKV